MSLSDSIPQNAFVLNFHKMFSCLFVVIALNYTDHAYCPTISTHPSAYNRWKHTAHDCQRPTRCNSTGLLTSPSNSQEDSHYLYLTFCNRFLPNAAVKVRRFSIEHSTGTRSPRLWCEQFQLVARQPELLSPTDGTDAHYSMNKRWEYKDVQPCHIAP